MSPEAQVLVVGESLMDVVIDADGGETDAPGGSPANVALGLARLGVGARLVTALARDAYGEAIAAHLEASGVMIDAGSWSLDRTASARATIAADGSATYDFDIAWQLPAAPALAGERMLHTGSIAAFLAPGAALVREAVAAASGRALVTFDPNIRPALIGDADTARVEVESLAASCDVVKLSDEDAAWLYPGRAIDVVVAELLGAGAGVVAVTLGGDGAVVANTEASAAVPAVPVDVRDTVGAGDTFMAALIAGLLATDAPPATLDHDALARLGKRAVTAASITVGRVGADLPTARELEHALDAATVRECLDAAACTSPW
ncbi:carbohydrate kinase family protein [Agromyces mangrovi Wang et al. 2018]|uniref:carbohydrate kinase family protein n=1 Tax=Agromyces mangrovi TaxID=1858653 RepID=UPI002572B2FA|nr:carbohydrate kinase [Agromyces mangrovi]BDZ64166.1 ribokinase [Agromyces mangrovi]